MSNSTASPYPAPGHSSTPSPVLPPLQTRRAACTHLTMERLYGQFTCAVCRRPSSWGWVYCCTQDDKFDGETAAPRDSLPDQPAWTADLAPWVQKAIEQGHYTTEQVEKLVAQRQKVLDAIAESVAHFRAAQEIDSSRCMSYLNSLSTFATTSGTNGGGPPPSIPNFSADTRPPTPNVPRQSTDSWLSPQKENPRIFPFCRYRACQHCRPTYRDRTWQIFQDVFAAKSLPPELQGGDLSGPPVSNITRILNLGIRPARPARPQFNTRDSMGLYDADDEGRRRSRNPYARRSNSTFSTAPVLKSVADLAKQRAEAEDTKGFRDSVRKAFKGMLISPHRKRDSGSSSKRKRESGEEQELWQDPAEFDLGLWKQLTDELLKEAAETPLPDDGEDDWGEESEEGGVEVTENGRVDGVEDGAEVEVEGGVAVTEEAVETGTADIIMGV
ncbi:MAG: hypothetical protein Q9194_006462 [Teloschistes cf. exilis]